MFVSIAFVSSVKKLDLKQETSFYYAIESLGVYVEPISLTVKGRSEQQHSTYCQTQDKRHSA